VNEPASELSITLATQLKPSDYSDNPRSYTPNAPILSQQVPANWSLMNS
jgi:hypothetical protein